MQDNWKTAHSYMKSVGINMKGIEPAGEFLLIEEYPLPLSPFLLYITCPLYN